MPQVLIVDDRAINRELFVMLLRPARYETLEASSGAEALVMALEHHPDAVILDQAMPGMDGLTLVKTMRENRALDDIAIIFYTAALNCGGPAQTYGARGDPGDARSSPARRNRPRARCRRGNRKI